MSEEGMPTVSQNKSKCVCNSPFLVEMPVPSQGHYDFHGCWLIVSVYILMSFDFPCYVFSLRHINMNAIVEYFISYHILA
jgi:hypothetical protein